MKLQFSLFIVSIFSIAAQLNAGEPKTAGDISRETSTTGGLGEIEITSGPQAGQKFKLFQSEKKKFDALPLQTITLLKPSKENDPKSVIPYKASVIIPNTKMSSTYEDFIMGKFDSYYDKDGFEKPLFGRTYLGTVPILGGINGFYGIAVFQKGAMLEFWNPITLIVEPVNTSIMAKDKRKDFVADLEENKDDPRKMRFKINNQGNLIDSKTQELILVGKSESVEWLARNDPTYVILAGLITTPYNYQPAPRLSKEEAAKLLSEADINHAVLSIVRENGTSEKFYLPIGSKAQKQESDATNLFETPAELNKFDKFIVIKP